MKLNKLNILLMALLLIFSMASVSAVVLDDSIAIDLGSVDDNDLISTVDSSNSNFNFSTNSNSSNDFDSNSNLLTIDSDSNSYLFKNDSNSLLLANSTSSKEILINDSNYYSYFNKNGKFNYKVDADTKIVIGEINNKNLIFNQTVNIDGQGVGKITNGQIILYPGASGSIVTNLNMVYSDIANTNFFGLISLDSDGGSTGLKNFSITNNKLSIINTTLGLSNYVQAICVYCNGSKFSSNILIANNTIEMFGKASCLQGIAIYEMNSNFSLKSGSGFYILDNKITVNAYQTAEAISLHDIENVIVKGNDLTSNSYFNFSGISENDLKLLDSYDCFPGLLGIEDDSNVLGVNRTLYDFACLGILNQETNTEFVSNLTHSYVLNKETNKKLSSANQMSELSFSTAFTIDDYIIQVLKYKFEGKVNSFALALMNVNYLYCINNTINSNSENSNGIFLYHDNNITITLNKINVYGKMAYAIKTFVVNNDTVNHNFLTVKGDNAFGYYGSMINNDTVSNNYVDVKTVYDNYTIAPAGIKYLAISSNSTIANNCILVNSNYNEIYGIVINAGIKKSNITVENNFILSNKGKGTKFIYVYNTTGNSVIEDNIAFSRDANLKDKNVLIYSDSKSNVSTKKSVTVLYNNLITSFVSSSDGRVGDYFTATLVDNRNNPLVNKTVSIGFNGKVYSRTTNSSGGISLQINLASFGLYTFAISFLGDDEFEACFVVAVINVTKKESAFSVSLKTVKITGSAKTKTVYVTLYDEKTGEALANQIVSFTINGKTYTKATDDTGLVTVNVCLKANAYYTYVLKYAGNDYYQSSIKTAILRW